MQPIFRMHEFVNVNGSGKTKTNVYIFAENINIGAGVFQKGICLQSDNNMIEEEQSIIIEVVKRCLL